MKKIIILLMSLAIQSAYPVAVIEYNIANIGGTKYLPLNPEINLINASHLSFSGSEHGFDDIGQAGAYNWQVSPELNSVNPYLQHYSFSITPTTVEFDFLDASLTFGASTQFNGNMAIFVNNDLFGNLSLGTGGNFDNHYLSLSSIGLISQPIEIKLVGWGLADVGYLGLDTGIIPATFENLKINNVVMGSPIPEPLEYMTVICCLLIIFLVIRHRTNYAEN